MEKNYEEEYRQYVADVNRKMVGCKPISYDKWLNYEKQKEQGVGERK